MTTILAVIGTALAYELYISHRQELSKARRRERRRFMDDYSDMMWRWKQEGRRQ